MQAKQSLFLALHKWAQYQDENFCTEGLIYILRLMLIEAPSQALDVIGWLTAGLICSDTPADTIKISGQVISPNGRPDVEIEAGLKKAWIEVKVDSAVGSSQLQRYRKDLIIHGAETKLLLLSHGGDGHLSEENRPHTALRWADLANRLAVVVKSLDNATKIFFVVVDYLEFINARRFIQKSISIEAINNADDVDQLLALVKLACKADGKRTWKQYAGPTRGYYIYDAGDCTGWVGFNTSDLNKLYFNTNKFTVGYEKIDPDLAMTSGLPDATYDGTHWTNCIDLNKIEGFDSIITEAQVEYIRKHLIEDSLKAFRAMLKPVIHQAPV